MLAISRQRSIQDALKVLQSQEIKKIREWMTMTEDKISR